MDKDILNKTPEEQEVLLNDMHGHDLKDLYEQLDDDEKVILLSKLDDENMVELLSYLEPEEASQIVISLDDAAKKTIVNQMEPDDAIDIINELEDDERSEFLNLVEDEDTKQLLSYDEDSAAGHMTVDIISLLPSNDVKDALKKVIKEAPNVESIQTLFVVDDEDYYLGTVNLKQLIKAKSPTLISEIMTKTPYVLSTEHMVQVAHQMDNYALYEIAVIDKDEKLLGMITLDDALEHYQEEAIEDFRKLSLVTDELSTKPLKAAFVRLPWLLLLLILSIPIAFLSKGFDDVLMAVAILGLFQPLILDASGDVATQSLAVSLRVLNKSPKDTYKNGLYEVITGVINGLIMSILAFIITYFLASSVLSVNHAPILLSTTIAVTLFLTVVFGQTIGFFIPLILNKFKIDPAAASGPLITTLADLFSIFFFFGLAKVILGV